MKIKTIVSAILLAGTFSGQVHAVDTENALDRKYQYVGLGVSRVSADDLDYSVNNIGITLKALLNENLYYSVALDSMEDDMAEDNITVSTLKAAIGARYSMSESADVFAQAGWTASLVDELGGEQDEVTSTNVAVGSHYLVSEHFVAGVNLGYVVPENEENYVSWGVDGTFYINEQFSYTIGYNKGDDSSSYNLMLSLHY